jgi:cobalt-zinc-cadmium efflux system outer membrane protein
MFGNPSKRNRAPFASALVLLAASSTWICADQPGPDPPAAAQPVEDNQAPAQASGLTFEQAVSIALSSNRSLAAARLQRVVEVAAVGTAKERPNPELAFESVRDAPHQSLVLSLPLEVASKRQRRIELAQAEVASGQAELQRQIVEIRNQVRRAFYGQLAAAKKSDLARDLLGIAQRTLDAAKTRFEAGAVPRLEVLQADLAATQASNEVQLANAELLSARGDLNTLLNRPPSQPTHVIGELDEGEVPTVEAVTELALHSNTELALLDRKIAAATARLNVARSLQVPDPVISGGLSFNNQPDFTYGYKAGASITLPLFTRHRAAVLVEQATIEQLQAQREALVAQTRGAVYAAVARAAAQREQYLSYRDQIQPRATQVEQMAEESYRAGETGLVALLQALQATREVRTRAVQAGVDYQLALADLERALGAPLP